MPTANRFSLSIDQIDDLLYLARLGETIDLKTAVDLFAKNLSTTPETILTAAFDKDNGNGLLHMAAANGHTGCSYHASHIVGIYRCTMLTRWQLP